MRRGPKPAPLKVLRGRHCRQVARRLPELKLRPGMPSAPEGLSPAALTLWRQIAAHAADLGVVHLDESALIALTQAWSDYQDLRNRLRREGGTFTTASGFRGRNPTAGLMDQAFSRYRILAAQFGLTPAARAGMHAAVPEGDGPDALEKLLSRRPVLRPVHKMNEGA